MENNAVIQVNEVSKKFCRSLKRSMWYGFRDILRDTAGLRPKSGRLRRKEFWAVDDVSFELKKGETLGLIGPNGAGKTTLLKMLNGIIIPDKGRVEIKGRVGALIQVGAGFHPQLTGRENIYINGAILGMGKREIDKKFDAIVEFADIGDFLNTPVKHYSSGMFVRLGFAVAVHCEPDILLVDEILSVGDYSYRTKCAEKISSLRRKNTTIILVSHNLDLIYNTCKKVIYLNEGHISFEGDTLQGIETYIKRANQTRNQANLETTHNKRIGFTKINLLNGNAIPTDKFYTGDKMIIQLEVTSREKIRNPVFGVSLHRSDGVYVASFNTKRTKFGIECWKGTGNIRLMIESLPLTEGQYNLSTAITTQDSITSYDYLPHAVSFEVKEKHSYKVIRNHGIVCIPCEWEVSLKGESKSEE